MTDLLTDIGDTADAAPMIDPITLSGTRTSHRWTELPGNFDRLNLKAIFPSSNKWGIPDLDTTTWEPDQLVPYNSRTEIVKAPPNTAAIHFFVDDYRFETVWTQPHRSLSRITRIGAALTPDFSLWRDMPPAMQLWQVYRSRWCGAWLRHHGIKTIPTMSWSTPDSYAFAFAGIAQHSTVAISTVGIRDPATTALFTSGCMEMVQQLNPARILVYGNPELVTQVVPDSPTRHYPARRNHGRAR